MTYPVTRGAMARRGLAALLSAVVLGFSVGSTQAAPITTDLTLSADVAFDNLFALATPGVSQSGSYSITQGGAATTSTYNGTTVTGANPLLGTLTDTGDGLAISGRSSAAPGGEFAVGIDFALNMANSSATNPYKITFRFTADNRVDSSGTDAFADSEFSISDPAVEVFFSDIVSDTVFGNEVGGTPTGTFGGPVTEAASALFDVTIAPLDMVDLTGFWTLEGSEFSGLLNSGASAAFAGTLTVLSVLNLNVPEPGTLALFVAGLLGLMLVVRRRRPRSAEGGPATG